MRSRVALLLGILIAGSSAVGCGVSPQPSPPVITADLVELFGGVAADNGGIAFTAKPGSVEPAKGVVVITNLDTTDTPSIATVAPDGSFSIAVGGLPSQRFRFQAKDGNARSEPFDFLVAASNQSVSLIDPTPACLEIDPARWASFAGAGDGRSIVVHNTCDTPIAFAAPHLRRGRAGFSFSPASAIALGAGGDATLDVEAGQGAEVEDVLLFDVTSPQTSLRAITLTVPDP